MSRPTAYNMMEGLDWVYKVRILTSITRFAKPWLVRPQFIFLSWAGWGRREDIFVRNKATVSASMGSGTIRWARTVLTLRVRPENGVIVVRPSPCSPLLQHNDADSLTSRHPRTRVTIKGMYISTVHMFTMYINFERGRLAQNHKMFVNAHLWPHRRKHTFTERRNPSDDSSESVSTYSQM